VGGLPETGDEIAEMAGRNGPNRRGGLDRNRRRFEPKYARGYCAAVRSAITDDGRPPLAASGLKLRQRLTAVAESLDRVAEKGD
jgi:hypothetical protein